MDGIELNSARLNSAGLDSKLDNQALADTAVQVACEAAELVRTARANAITKVDTKSSATDVVTAADRDAEQLIKARLVQLRPGEPMLGEEEASDEGVNATNPAGLLWVVDPIDGTTNYLYGYPWYAVSVAAQWQGISVAGAVVEPESGRVWRAARGHGAQLNGKPLRTSSANRLDLALVATGFSYLVERRRLQASLVAELIPKVRDIRRFGAASLDLCAVAAGWCDGYFEVGLKPWDWAAAALIAEEAGAVVHLPGSNSGLAPQTTFAAAPGVADALLAEIQHFAASSALH